MRTRPRSGRCADRSRRLHTLTLGRRRRTRVPHRRPGRRADLHHLDRCHDAAVRRAAASGARHRDDLGQASSGRSRRRTAGDPQRKGITRGEVARTCDRCRSTSTRCCRAAVPATSPPPRSTRRSPSSTRTSPARRRRRRRRHRLHLHPRGHRPYYNNTVAQRQAVDDVPLADPAGRQERAQHLAGRLQLPRHRDLPVGLREQPEHRRHPGPVLLAARRRPRPTTTRARRRPTRPATGSGSTTRSRAAARARTTG